MNILAYTCISDEKFNLQSLSRDGGVGKLLFYILHHVGHLDTHDNNKLHITELSLNVIVLFTLNIFLFFIILYLNFISLMHAFI